jgi:hypothetical protein
MDWIHFKIDKISSPHWLVLMALKIMWFYQSESLPNRPMLYQIASFRCMSTFLGH